MRTIETPSDLAQLMKDAMASVEHYRQLANQKHGLNLPPFKVEFTAKGGLAGQAQIGKHTIRLNPKILRLNPDRFLKRTTGHEVAHFVVHHLYIHKVANSPHPIPRPKSHGGEWQRVMMSLGITDNSARHDYKIKEGCETKAPVASTSYQSVHGQVRAFGVGKIVEFD